VAVAVVKETPMAYAWMICAAVVLTDLVLHVDHAAQLVGSTETTSLLARGVEVGRLGAAVVLTDLILHVDNASQLVGGT
jgi:hypothetical protein